MNLSNKELGLDTYAGDDVKQAVKELKDYFTTTQSKKRIDEIFGDKLI